MVYSAVLRVMAFVTIHICLFRLVALAGAGWEAPESRVMTGKKQWQEPQRKQRGRFWR